MRRAEGKRRLAIPLVLAIAGLLAVACFVSPRARIVVANVYYRAQIRWLDSGFATRFQDIWSVLARRRSAYDALARNGAIATVKHDFGVRLSAHDCWRAMSAPLPRSEIHTATGATTRIIVFVDEPELVRQWTDHFKSFRSASELARRAEPGES